MRCPSENDEAAGFLMDYCVHRLSPGETAMVEDHLRICGGCRELVRAQQALLEALDTWEATPVPADFNRRFWARVKRENQKDPAARWLDPLAAWWTSLSWRPITSLAAVCVLAVAAVCIQAPKTANQLVEPSQPAVDRVDVEQVERTLEDIEMLRQLNPAPAGETGPSTPI